MAVGASGLGHAGNVGAGFHFGLGRCRGRCQLVFRRRLAADRCATPGGVGQAANGARGAIDGDRIRAAGHEGRGGHFTGEGRCISKVERDVAVGVFGAHGQVGVDAGDVLQRRVGFGQAVFARL